MTPYRRYGSDQSAASITGRKTKYHASLRIKVSGNSFIASSSSEGVGLWR